MHQSVATTTSNPPGNNVKYPRNLRDLSQALGTDSHGYCPSLISCLSTNRYCSSLTEQIFELSHGSDLFSRQKLKKAIYGPTYFKSLQILMKMSSSVMTKVHVMVYKSCIFGQTRVCICLNLLHQLKMLGLTQPYHKKHSPGEGWVASVSYVINVVNFL